MSDKYWVAMRPGINGDHAVHKEDCPFLPDDDKSICLGEFSSGEDALREGQRHFTRTKRCIFCFKEDSVHDEIPFRFKLVETDHVEPKTTLSYQEGLICCVN